MDEKGGTEKRRRSYRSGARIAKERMAREAPLDAEAWPRWRPRTSWSCPARYDHVEQVLEALEMPYTRVATRPTSARSSSGPSSSWS